jgi:hypothetical protein
MALFDAEGLRAAARAELRPNQWIQKSAAVELRNFAASAGGNDEFDIFLSHSYQDQEVIFGLRSALTKLNFRVYVDWIDDPQLNRDRVTKETARNLRNRLKKSRCLFYATSRNTVDSKWMPWELGFMDGFSRERVAICPLTGGDRDDFSGQEYLGLYPYVTIYNGATLYIHETVSKWMSFSNWLAGSESEAR